jgi:N-acyl homoserine lactone hydrolase
MKRLIPLVVGWLTVNTTTFFPPAPPEERMQCPVLIWLIEWDGHLLLFDTGGTSPEVAHTTGHPHYRRSLSEEPWAKLQHQCGIHPDDIEIIILSHLHWDHAANWKMFPRASILVQAVEVQCALAPKPTHRQYFDFFSQPAAYIQPERFTQVQGAVPIDGVQGLHLVALPGHTPGSQGLLLDDGKRRLMLAGDTVPLYRNWQSDPPIPNGIADDVRQFHRTLHDLAQYEAIVFPSHEPAIAACDGKDIRTK